MIVCQEVQEGTSLCGHKLQSQDLASLQPVHDLVVGAGLDSMSWCPWELCRLCA